MALLSSRNKGVFAADNLLPLSVVISMGLGLFNLLLLISLSISTFNIARRPEPRLVQLVDGRSILTEPMPNRERSPEVIREFARSSLTMMFTWSGVRQTNSAAGVSETSSDQGVDVDGARVTTRSWQSSFAISDQDDFRSNFLQAVGEMTPASVFEGNAQSVFNIESLSEPIEVSEGEWIVEMVANLLIFDAQNPRGRAIPFNKEIRIRAIEPPADPLAENASPIQQAVYQIRSAGLEITEMNDLVR
jgi:hypothetical protein